jgi:membrane protease YdiL (CAAX protease family)
VKFLHSKKFIHLITPDEKFDINRFFFGFGIWLCIGIFFEVVFYFINPVEMVFQFDASKFFILLLICIFLLPIQTSFEEFFVRGYLMQGLSLLFKNKIVLMFLSSFLFASLHLMNPEIEKYGIGIMLTYYVLAGVVLALFTIMDGRLELALGIHFATNFFGATVATYDGSVIQTDALFKQGDINPYLMVLSLLLLSFTFYVLASKIYNWKSIKYILEPVVLSEDQPLIRELNT